MNNKNISEEEEKENMRLYQAQYYYLVRKPLIQLKKKLDNPNYKPRNNNNNNNKSNKKIKNNTYYYPSNPLKRCYNKEYVDVNFIKLDKPIKINFS